MKLHWLVKLTISQNSFALDIYFIQFFSFIVVFELEQNVQNSKEEV